MLCGRPALTPSALSTANAPPERYSGEPHPIWRREMKKRMVYLLVLAALALAACTPAAATEAPSVGTGTEGLPDLGGREVTVTVENAYLPFNYIDPVSAEPAGWDYEVWNEMCRV